MGFLSGGLKASPRPWTSFMEDLNLYHSSRILEFHNEKWDQFWAYPVFPIWTQGTEDDTVPYRYAFENGSTERYDVKKIGSASSAASHLLNLLRMHYQKGSFSKWKVFFFTKKYKNSLNAPNAATYRFDFFLNPPVESRLLLDFLHLGDELFRRGPHIGLTAPGGQGQPVRAKFLRLHAGLEKTRFF